MPKKPRRSRRPPSGAASTGQRMFLVAVGASAGGLHALGKLLAPLPRDFAAPIVAVIHLDPGHVSRLAPLLQRHTKLRVKQAENGEALRGGTVYLAAPNRHLEVSHGKIHVTHSRPVRFSRPSVDRLFATAAKAYGDRMIAVVLSGMGSDGSVGVSEVKAQGGVVLAQDAQEAEFPGMPESATRTGCVDIAAPIGRLPAILRKALHGDATPLTVVLWRALFELLAQEFGTDFRKYRSSTLKRRLQRRILASGQPDFKSYLALLRRDPEELKQLHAAFLIKVSNFFRDPEEWKELDESVVRVLTGKGSGNDEIRVWSAGCATGEEAYSLAILFLDALGPQRSGRLRVFGTDIDGSALATARAGIYTAAQVARLPRSMLERHFDPHGDDWRAKKSLRKAVVFGKHDLLHDPPLASLNLIACRNVLIYFTSDEARPVLDRFRYAVKPGGFLFLGRSEMARAPGHGFERVAAASKILRRTRDPHLPRQGKRAMARAVPMVAVGSNEGPPGHKSTKGHAFERVLSGAASVVLFVVDGGRRITHWNRAAEVTFGIRATAAIGKDAEDVLGASCWEGLKPAVQRVLAEHRPTRVPRLVFQPWRQQPRYLGVECIPFPAHTRPAGSVLFIAVDATGQHAGEVRQQELLEEVRRAVGIPTTANEGLQAANEELETLNEELQSTSEEQQTLNEELESRNEELQTVNEELQSMNEELNTLNEEVGARIADADRLGRYLRTVLESNPQAVIGCDVRHTVTFWNAAARKLFRLSEAQAMGHHLLKMVPALDVPRVRTIMKGRPGTAPVWIDAGKGVGRIRIGMTLIRDARGQRAGYVLRVQEGRAVEERPRRHRRPQR